MANLEKERRLPSPSWMSWYRDPVLLLAISLVFSLDQITKAVVRNSLLEGHSYPRDGLVRITHTFNTGSAFGLFPNQTLFLILASFVGIAILLLVYRNHMIPSFLLRASLGLQLGGALGNLADRLRMGQVTDFVDLGFWPVFNLADASIVIGLFILFSLFLFAGRESEHASQTVGAPSAVHPGYDGEEWPLEEEPGPLRDILCPMCDSSMVEVPGGWSCSGCGIKEWVEHRKPW